MTKEEHKLADTLLLEANEQTGLGREMLIRQYAELIETALKRKDVDGQSFVESVSNMPIIQASTNIQDEAYKTLSKIENDCFVKIMGELSSLTAEQCSNIGTFARGIFDTADRYVAPKS